MALYSCSWVVIPYKKELESDLAIVSLTVDSCICF